MLLSTRTPFTDEDIMELDIHQEGDITLVRVLEKRLDANAAVPFKQRMKSMIDEGRKRIIIDITEVDFIDSSGLGAIVSCLKAVGRDGNVVISGTGRAIMSMFRLTRMDRVFDMYDTPEAALAAMTK